MSKRREVERAALDREVGQPHYQNLLDSLKGNHPVFTSYGDWKAVIAFMQGNAASDQDKDAVLRPILVEHARQQDPRWRDILLLMFWPGVNSLADRKRTWDVDYDDLWSNAILAFLEVVTGIDPAKRKKRLAQKIFNDTLRRFIALCDEQTMTECTVGSKVINAIIDNDATHIQPGLSEQSILEEYEAAGIIGEIELQLLLGTLVHGQSVEECAEDLGITYGAAKKRRQRAITAIRSLEKI